MKKLLVLTVAFAGIFASCDRDNNKTEVPQNEKRSVVIHASQRELEETRAQLDVDGLKVRWEVGDRVAVYMREPYVEGRAQEDGWLDEDIFTVVSVDPETGKATLSGSLEWEPNTEYHMYAYTPVLVENVKDLPRPYEVLKTVPSNQTNYVSGDGSQLYDFPRSSIMIASPEVVITPAEGEPELDMVFHNMLTIFEMRIKLPEGYTGEVPVISSVSVFEAKGKSLQANQVTCNITTGPSEPVLGEVGTQVWAEIYDSGADEYGYALSAESPLVVRTMMLPSKSEGYELKIGITTTDNRSVVLKNNSAVTSPVYSSGYRYWTEIPLDPSWLTDKTDDTKYNGTPEPPVGNGSSSVTVNNAAQMAYVVNEIQNTGYDANTTITLNTDVDMGGYTFTGGSAEFKGTFRGRGHTISNFTIDGTGKQDTGFFPQMPGAVINLHLDAVTIITSDGGRSCGGFAGYSAASGRIDNCSFNGTINSKSQYTGGFIGYFTSSGNATMHINACKNMGNITGTAAAGVNPAVGGIVGCYDVSGPNRETNIVENCYTTGGTISGANGYVGGIVGLPGQGQDRATYRNCYIDSPVTGPTGTTGNFSGAGLKGSAYMVSVWYTENTIPTSVGGTTVRLMNGSAWPTAAAGTNPNQGWVIGANTWGDMSEWTGGGAEQQYPQLWWEITPFSVE